VFVLVVARSSTISNGRIFGLGVMVEGDLVGLVLDHLLIRLVLVGKMGSLDSLVMRRSSKKGGGGGVLNRRASLSTIGEIGSTRLLFTLILP